MSKTARYLKAEWVRRQFDLALSLLPPGVSLVLLLGGKRLAQAGAAATDLTESTAGVLVFPLMIEGEPVGTLLLLPPSGAEIPARNGGAFVTHALQGMLDAEHARRSVTQETLESYREMALLQRAANELNRSLKPAEVAAALLREFEGEKNGADCGAVFIRNTEGGLDLMKSFGIASEAFVTLSASAFFADIAASETGDIVNVLPFAPMWANEVPEFESLLWLPLIAHGENLGLLVLALRREGGFSAGDMKRAQTLSSVAAAALRNAQMYAAEQAMFQSFVRVIATAIDAKSPYTAGHCRRVPEIALLIADTVHQACNGPFTDFVLDENERNAMEIAAMLHDCGKVVTPDWIIDKATKLDAIVNRLDLVALRFELLRCSALAERDRAVAGGVEPGVAESAYRSCLHRLDDDFAFLRKCNTGGEFISPEHAERIRGIAAASWSDVRGEVFPLLDENEVYNLCTQRGTLNPEERKIIEDHAVHTINMLSQIGFPRVLRNVTEYAAGHHERMDGRGYPRGLRREELSIPARIIAIADIFEALTAPDRPYRKPGTLSWAIGIMHQMKLENHIDGELFDLFLSERVFLAYAQKHLAPEQIDEVDISRYLG